MMEWHFVPSSSRDFFWQFHIHHVFISSFQPVELLPCSIDEIREHCQEEGDLSFEALIVLRQAEDERRRKYSTEL